jgi:hypothetical protein
MRRRECTSRTAPGCGLLLEIPAATVRLKADTTGVAANSRAEFQVIGTCGVTSNGSTGAGENATL